MNNITVNIILFSKFVFFLGYLLNQIILPSSAQISPDGTTSTTVDANGNNFTINNGEPAGNNLFHSFQEFSVPTGGEAFFNNATDIANIFSRITGRNISNIDGLIRANGTANLFLINPNGIIFGENASLDIGGSFYSSTADSILFDQGEFSASDSNNPPLLTINAPIGLNFRDNPADIQVQGATLVIQPSRALAFIGGNIDINGGRFNAPSGHIEIGGLADAGTINLEENLSLNFPDNIARGNVLITNNSTIRTISDNGGRISFQAKDLTISDSTVFSGILPQSGTPESLGGNIEVDATGSVALNNGSQIDSSSFGIGSAGNITINARDSVTIDDTAIFSASLNQGQGGNIDIVSNNFEMNNQSRISALTTGLGSGGDLNIQATSISLSNTSAIINGTQGEGNAGNINIQASSLSFTDGSGITSSTDAVGNAGNINVNASDSVTIIGTAPVEVINGVQGGFSSGFFSSSDAPATGQGGTVTVTTDRLQISDGAVIGARTKTTAFGGNVIVNANNLDITGGGQILTATFAEGNAGNITLNIADEVNISGSDPTFFTRRTQVIDLVNEINTGQIVDPEQTIDPISPISGVFANTSSSATGNAGTININANSIDLTGGSISASTNAGNQGNITLNIADNLTLRDDGLISARALSNADGGNININSQFIIAFPSERPNNGNDIVADALQGRGGNIEITAESLFGVQEREALANNGTNDIDASSDFGLDGTVSITNPDTQNIQTDVNLPNDIIESDRTVAQACSNNALSDASNLTLKGKGGLPPKPTQPLNSERILLDEPITNPEQQARYPEIKPIKTSIGDIYPARGVIRTQDGRILLTAYPTKDIAPRTPYNSSNCS